MVWWFKCRKKVKWLIVLFRDEITDLLYNVPYLKCVTTFFYEMFGTKRCFYGMILTKVSQLPHTNTAKRKSAYLWPMLTISQRGQDMPPSPIRKLVPFAEAAKKKGIKVYHLNIGQPDIETPPAILDAVKHADIKVLEYSHSAGNESYRRKLVEYYKRVGIEVSHDQIMITTGGSEAILFGFFTCLNPGDEVIIPEPFYANYNGFACTAGVKVVPITSHIENGFALPPIDAFEKVITPRTRGIVVCNPNNPTGYLYSREEMEALRDICIRHDLYLFSDEAYREFCYDGEYISAMQAARA